MKDVGTSVRHLMDVNCIDNQKSDHYKYLVMADFASKYPKYKDLKEELSEFITNMNLKLPKLWYICFNNVDTALNQEKLRLSKIVSGLERSKHDVDTKKNEIKIKMNKLEEITPEIKRVCDEMQCLYDEYGIKSSLFDPISNVDGSAVEDEFKTLIENCILQINKQLMKRGSKIVYVKSVTNIIKGAPEELLRILADNGVSEKYLQLLQNHYKRGKSHKDEIDGLVIMLDPNGKLHVVYDFEIKNSASLVSKDVVKNFLRLCYIHYLPEQIKPVEVDIDGCTYILNAESFKSIQPDFPGSLHFQNTRYLVKDVSYKIPLYVPFGPKDPKLMVTTESFINWWYKASEEEKVEKIIEIYESQQKNTVYLQAGVEFMAEFLGI
tara:strand:- start:2236 stop:3375 length:1140 start_codon:yes stop_codon:yes gene_type:complete